MKNSGRGDIQRVGSVNKRIKDGEGEILLDFRQRSEFLRRESSALILLEIKFVQNQLIPYTLVRSVNAYSRWIINKHVCKIRLNRVIYE